MSSAPAPRLHVVGGDEYGRGERPALSWALPDGAVRQLGYRLRTADGYDSGPVDTAVQTLVELPGFDVSRRVTTVRVQVRTDLGESEWSEPLAVATGLRNEHDWTAGWIGVAEAERAPRGQGPVYWLRTTFDLDEPPAGARLHATALGLYEAYLNGTRVGDVELAPGYTQYRARVPAQFYDVGELLRPGRNALAVLLADGWFRGQVGMPRLVDQFGAQTALRVQLESAAGSVLTATGPGWRTSTSHVLAADLIGGQREDRRLADPAVHDAGFDDAGWAPAEARAVDVAVVAPIAPPVRRVQELTPVAVTSRPDGARIVDLGQNINGWLRVSDLGPAGTTLTIRHGEHLDPDGELTTTHLDVNVPIFPEPLPLGQVDEAVSAGAAGDTFEPRFTTHGFRYARIEGHPVEAADVVGVVVHSDLRRTGWFSCSDERLDRLHEAVVWSLRDNVCGIPTDCPQRERAGWVGDWQVFAPAAAFLYDVLGFTRSWLRDVRLEQRADGCVANMAPCPAGEGFDGPTAALIGSAGWGDAVVSVPWDLYRAYGDVELLREMWTSATRWVDYAAHRAATERHPARAAARPEPASHETYLWDAGFQWGEWLEPDLDLSDFGAFFAADKSDVATAYLHRSADQLVRIGTLLGVSPDDLARYRRIADGARDAWRAEFVAPDGTLRVATQAAHVRALAFGLVPDEQRPGVARELVRLIADAGDHLGTGFLCTGLLLPTLADAGHLDTAYDLLLQDTEPSWLTMIDRGATTVWERWNGVDADGIAHESLNHYSKGAVVDFLHRYVGGLAPLEPGYRTFLVRPQPGGGLTSASVRHDSLYGPITVEWRVVDATLTVDVGVPGGTSAQVQLPNGRVVTFAPGSHQVADHVLTVI